MLDKLNISPAELRAVFESTQSAAVSMAESVRALLEIIETSQSVVPSKKQELVSAANADILPLADEADGFAKRCGGVIEYCNVIEKCEQNVLSCAEGIKLPGGPAYE